MKWFVFGVAPAAVLAICSATSARPLLHDPVELNIGVTCQWQSHCMFLQRAAMKRSLSYVSTGRPPHWRVQLCNRNAARGGYRVDWIGFNNCIRNAALMRPLRSQRR